MNAQKRMEELIDILNKANYEYYVLANPTIEDMEYDKYLRNVYGDYMKLPPKEKRRTHGFQRLDFGPYKD